MTVQACSASFRKKTMVVDAHVKRKRLSQSTSLLLLETNSNTSRCRKQILPESKTLSPFDMKSGNIPNQIETKHQKPNKDFSSKPPNIPTGYGESCQKKSNENIASIFFENPNNFSPKPLTTLTKMKSTIVPPVTTGKFSIVGPQTKKHDASLTNVEAKQLYKKQRREKRLQLTKLSLCTETPPPQASYTKGLKKAISNTNISSVENTDSFENVSLPLKVDTAERPFSPIQSGEKLSKTTKSSRTNENKYVTPLIDENIYSESAQWSSSNYAKPSITSSSSITISSPSSVVLALTASKPIDNIGQAKTETKTESAYFEHLSKSTQSPKNNKPNIDLNVCTSKTASADEEACHTTIKTKQLNFEMISNIDSNCMQWQEIAEMKRSETTFMRTSQLSVSTCQPLNSHGKMSVHHTVASRTFWSSGILITDDPYEDVINSPLSYYDQNSPSNYSDDCFLRSQNNEFSGSLSSDLPFWSSETTTPEPFFPNVYRTNMS